MKERGGGALSRTLQVLVLYAAAAAVAWVAIPFIQTTFLLPPLFTTLSRGVLVLGAPVAALVAWRYPELGDSDPGARED